MTKDKLRPDIPFNTSDLAAFQRQLRHLGTAGSDYSYDQWLDFREIFVVGDLEPYAHMLRADAVPFGVWGRPSSQALISGQNAASCSIFVAEPKNGLVVELLQQSGPFGLTVGPLCEKHPLDLCAKR